MKKFLVICFFALLSCNLYSQNYNYGLSQQDLNLLLGQYVPSGIFIGNRLSEQSFSWGKQEAVSGNDDMIYIDYEKVSASSFGKKYENHLVIYGRGLGFLIVRIEKIAANKFKLSLVSRYSSTLKDMGYIIITYLDDIHIVVDDTNCSVWWINIQTVYWKSAGPTVTARNKKAQDELPDYKE